MLNHLTELADIDARGLARQLAHAHSFTSFADVARQVLNLDSFEPNPFFHGSNGSSDPRTAFRSDGSSCR
ncbi:hypothetical protein [Nocardioides sp. YIM 152315]|uniref:hypothetical protein n=1 Tax=Nocardioides sp. YIM 152315 TaxID=3031760 RepID=UPI0023DC051F|nr:hypothetical protein [Nocardioides sp. YIM 152315]MDF1605466.1 hypothetical protein [Nocardioides sp. YIM 152315]